MNQGGVAPVCKWYKETQRRKRERPDKGYYYFLSSD